MSDQGNNKVTCEEEIMLERILADLALFTAEQVAPVVLHEIRRRLNAGSYEVRYGHRLGKRSKGSAAAVHFHGHEFFDGEKYIIYYSVQIENDTAQWYLQGMFNLSEIFPYHWDE